MKTGTKKTLCVVACILLVTAAAITFELGWDLAAAALLVAALIPSVGFAETDR